MKRGGGRLFAHGKLCKLYVYSIIYSPFHLIFNSTRTGPSVDCRLYGRVEGSEVSKTCAWNYLAKSCWIGARPGRKRETPLKQSLLDVSAL